MKNGLKLLPLDDSTLGQSIDLSASGQTFQLNCELGSYKVTKQGVLLPQSVLQDEKVLLRCDLADLDLAGAALLGAGSSGKVMEVTHKPSGRKLAVKRIPVAEQDKLREIRRELDALLSERHPNIISFYGAFYDQGCVLIALERMDGSLAEIVQVLGEFPEIVTRGVVRQILLAMSYLHKDRHVIHRDLKPSNVLFTRDGTVKVTDFGISAALQTTMQQVSTFVGTVTYMSPERLAGEDYTATSDIWSLGLTVMELCTGTHPYASALGQSRSFGFWDVLGCIEKGLPKLPQGKIYSSALQGFVEACTKRDPTQRPSAFSLLGTAFVELSDVDAKGVCQEWFEQAIGPLSLMRKSKEQTANSLAMNLLEKVCH